MPAYVGKQVKWFDITDNYESQLRNVALSHGFNKFSLTVDNNINNKLPYKDKEFDVVLAISVFLHQRPQHILKVMRELMRVGHKIVATAYYTKDKKFDIPGTILNGKRRKFNYDYFSLAKNEGWNINNIEYGQAYLYFTLKN